MNFDSIQSDSLYVYISTAVCIILVTAGLVWYSDSLKEGPDESETNTPSTATHSDMGTSTAADPENVDGTQSLQKKFTTTKREDGPNRFVSTSYDFSFQYPQNFSVSAFDDRGGHVVLVQTADGKTAMQVFISNWDEPTDAVTPERIKKDLPNLTIRSPETMKLSGGSDALTFIGESEKFGTTREVWFARSDNLFQIIAPAQAQEFVSSILETWKFR